MAGDGYAILQSCQHAQVTGRFAGHNAAADLAGVHCKPIASLFTPLVWTWGTRAPY